MEEHPTDVDGEEIPVNTMAPNPNGEEFDNLYLDMVCSSCPSLSDKLTEKEWNHTSVQPVRRELCMLHPVANILSPEDRPPPADEAEMMLSIFKYTERVMNMVRPRKLLMIAIGM